MPKQTNTFCFFHLLCFASEWAGFRSATLVRSLKRDGNQTITSGYVNRLRIIDVYCVLHTILYNTHTNIRRCLVFVCGRPILRRNDS